MLRADGEGKMNPSEQHNGKAGIAHEGLSHCSLIAYLGRRGEKAVGSQGTFLFSAQALLCASGMCLFSSPQVQVWVPFLGDLGEEGHLYTFSSVLDTSVCFTNATSV